MGDIASGTSLPDPGQIVLFGSGETSPTGRKIFERILRMLPQPPHLALLETPAGFELNSAQVIGRVGEFFTHRLRNYDPSVDIIPARRRGTEYSPDNPEILQPLLNADLIFMGPGSPSYAIRQLRASLAWEYLLARHRLGASLALASAATIAFSSFALPVYEIFKVGADLHWIEGLDFFKYYGLQLILIPHWDNNEGGSELDTSRCFMGRQRFAQLIEMLPNDQTILGLDEKTALVMSPVSCTCTVMGIGRVTLLHTGHEHQPDHKSIDGEDQQAFDRNNENLAMMTDGYGGHVHSYESGRSFHISQLGQFHAFQPEEFLPSAIWQQSLYAYYSQKKENYATPPDEVARLVQARQAARQARNWALADALREQVSQLGWEILDTQAGPLSRKIPG